MDIYEHFGFKESIFNIQSLNPTLTDAKKFIGRRKDIISFMTDISAKDRAMVLVTGNKGVGKTSFVNVMEFCCSQDRFKFEGDVLKESKIIPCYHKVQIDPDEDVTKFLYKCVSSIVYSLNKFRENDPTYPDALKEIDDWITEITPTTSVSMGASAAGFGASGAKGKTFRSYKDFLPEEYSRKIKTIIKIIKEYGHKGIFLNIENMEIVPEEKLIELVNSLRDYLFSIDGLWIVMIGYEGMYTTIKNNAPRVSEFINGDETVLVPLLEEEVITIIKMRQENLQIKKDQSLPLEEKFIRNIYNTSDGEVRGVFKACDDILRSVFKESPMIKTVSEEVGKPFLKSLLEKQTNFKSLKLKEIQFINHIAQKGAIRPKDYKLLSLKSNVDFTNRARPLLEKNLLTKEVEGNSAEYKLSGLTKMSLYAGIDFVAREAELKQTKEEE